MSFLRYPAAFLFFVLFASGAVSAVDVKKAVGDEVSFSPVSAIPTGASIIWKHRSNSGVVIKVIEYDEDGENIPNSNFQGITTLDKKTGKITIKNLTYAHKGVYTIDINSKEQEQKFSLTVMERVPKPQIKPEKIPNNADVMYLRCEYSETIIWKNSDGETLKGSAITPKGESTTVRREGKPEKFYTCTLQNDVSEETSERVYERDLFKGEDPSPIPAIIGGLFGILAAILLILVVLYKAFVPFHDLIHGNFSNRSCIGPLLTFLDCKKKGGKGGELEKGKEQDSTLLPRKNTDGDKEFVEEKEKELDEVKEVDEEKGKQQDEVKEVDEEKGKQQGHISFMDDQNQEPRQP